MNANVVKVLQTLGLSDPATVEFEPGANPGRVSIVHGTTAEVIWCDVHGHETSSTSQFATSLNLSPVAGDWVSVRDRYIVAVSARTTELRRPGSTASDVQLLAANIDIVLVVLPIDRELNLLMLERLAVMAFDSGATPIVVLTKSDGSAPNRFPLYLTPVPVDRSPDYKAPVAGILNVFLILQTLGVRIPGLPTA